MTTTFTAVHRSTGEERTFSACTLTPAHLELLLDFQQQQLPTIADPSTFQPSTREEYLSMLEHGFVLGLFWQEELVYFLACYYPGPSHCLGVDLSLPAEELDGVAHLEIAMAREDTRGFGLHQRAVGLCLEELSRDPRCLWACCTVSPFNLPSLKPLLRQGMEIGVVKKKYGGHWRYVMVKRMNRGE